MADKHTVIGADTHVTGEIRGGGSLEVRGRVEGKIQVEDTVTVAGGAIVQAEVEARVVEVAGVLVGNVTAGERVRLSDKARVIGDLRAPRVGIEAGAQYRGRVEMGEVDVSQRERTAAAASRGAGSAPAARVAPRLPAAAEAAGALRRPAPPARVASVPVRDGAAVEPPAWARKKARRR